MGVVAEGMTSAGFMFVAFVALILLAAVGVALFYENEAEQARGVMGSLMLPPSPHSFAPASDG
jgi:hypothetical protein